MTYTSRIAVALIAATCLSTPALAQETATTADEATTSADGNAADASGLSLGTSNETPVGGTYVIGEHGDWELRCIKFEDGNDPCQLYQLLEDQDGNSVAEMSMFNLRDQGQVVAGATIITPLETLLTQQVKLSVDGGVDKNYPFTFCSNVGCFSRVGFTADEVAGFRKGSSATLTIVPAAAANQTVDLTVSLSGFTAGYAAMEEANAPAE